MGVQKRFAAPVLGFCVQLNTGCTFTIKPRVAHEATYSSFCVNSSSLAHTFSSPSNTSTPPPHTHSIVPVCTNNSSAVSGGENKNISGIQWQLKWRAGPECCIILSTITKGPIFSWNRIVVYITIVGGKWVECRVKIGTCQLMSSEIIEDRNKVVLSGGRSTSDWLLL